MSSQPVFAHVLVYGAIKTELKIQDQTIQLQTTIPKTIASGLNLNKDGEFLFFERQFANKFLINQNGVICHFNLLSFDTFSTPDTSFFEGIFNCPQKIDSIESLTIESRIFSEYFERFDHFVIIILETNQWQLIFSQNKYNFPADVTPSLLDSWINRLFSVSREFIWLGVKHIWIGYDHILFLLSIILILRSTKEMFVLVTSFTIAHSITLILAGFQIVTIPSQVVEILIALSIVYIALRNINLLRQNKYLIHLSKHWMITFGFGLVHGLGFASVLMETSIPSGLFIPALLMFNLGVELGQVSILVITIPLLRCIYNHPLQKSLFIIFSSVIFIFALFWFFERIFVLWR